MWLWFQICKFQTHIMEWHTASENSVLILYKYTLILSFVVYYRISISVSFFYLNFSDNFKLTWARCISISYIDTIPNFVCTNFLPVPQPLTQARIFQIYNMQNIFIKIPIVLGSDWPLPSRSNLTLNQISLIPGHITRVNTRPIDDSSVYLDCFISMTVSRSISYIRISLDASQIRLFHSLNLLHG